LESAQAAWAAGSVEGVLDKYVDEVVYTTNTGSASGEALTIRGKENLRHRFNTAMAVIESRTRFETIRVENGLVRTRMTAVLEHRVTGYSMTCTMRQILRFEDFRIAEQHDFRDAAKMAAFWKLVGDPLERAHKPESV
jgi:ketosteroid isomerase-like protein